mmetsp:Transcript_24899/g.38767  ORF Transcript_24899/g.38767 Transcript_24899/m.38767 type:complete len:82 (+) Transcript_24899:417-662(+)
MIELRLSDNQFEGTIDVTRLPSGMNQLEIHSDSFFGETDFSKIPGSLRYDLLNDTELSGTIHITDWMVVNTEGSYVTTVQK